MLVVSPWSKGGYVNSQVFDHTSLIRFIEARFAADDPRLIETNITKWRRAVAGDLTSAFNFRTPNEARVRLPSTQGYAPTDNEIHPDYKPALPEVQELPAQEPGLRPARALPYELNVFSKPDASQGQLTLQFVNTGAAAAVFQVRPSAGQKGPWTYTVGARAQISDVWDLASESLGAYDLAVHGPNGFLRAFKGRLSGQGAANLDVRSNYLPSRCGVELAIQNRGSSACKLGIWDAYNARRITAVLRAGEKFSRPWPLERSFGWYDLTIDVDGDPSFLCQLAGHLETGRDSASDPAFAARG
jgi:phospholipase C